MAVIMKIRNRLGFVIVGLIMLAIAGFLLQDALSSNSSLLRGGATELGSVNGKTVDYQKYDDRVRQYMDNMRAQGQPNVDEQIGNIRDQVWNQYVNEIVMQKKYQDLGIVVTDEEMKEQLQGNNPHPYVRQSFTDPNTGRFDVAQVSRYIKDLKAADDSVRWNQWDNFKKSIKEERLNTKYNMLVKKAMYTPAWQANENYVLNAAKVNFEYVYLPYSDIPDADVSLTDSEIKNYINNHKTQYKRDESRAIEYIAFSITPSAKDTALVRTKLAELVSEFKTTDNDSVFISRNSDRPYDIRYVGKDELASSLSDTIFKMQVDSVIGPFFEEGAFKYVKLVDKKMIPDSVKARQIFFSFASAQSREEVDFKRAQADSIFKLVEAGGDFNSFVLQYSDDNATKFNGGDLGWIKPDTQPEAINTALFYQKKKGDKFLVPLYQTGAQGGVYIIEVTEATPSKEAVQVAFLEQQVTASTETERQIYAKANEFAAKHNKPDLFKSAGNEYTIRKADNITKNTYVLPGLGQARDVVKWTFEASVNEVSNVFTLDKDYVVALVTRVQEEGLASVDEVKGEVEAELKKEKKAELLKAKMTGGDLNAIASATGRQIETAAGLSMSNAFVGSAGSENKVVGKALGMETGETAVVAGDNGVFAIKVTSKDVPPALTDASAQKRQLSQSIESRVDYMLPEAIRKAAEIEDNRISFY